MDFDCKDITTTTLGSASTFPEHENQKRFSKLQFHRDLIPELLAMGVDDPMARDLGERLRRCEEAYERNRVWRTEGRVIGDTNIYFRCRRPACLRCRKVIVARATDKAQVRFCDVDNRDASFMTTLLSPTAELAALPDIIKQARRKFRDRRNAAARKWSCWGGVGLTGFVEVDARFVCDIPHLRPKLSAALQALTPYGCGAGADRLWIPHLHALVYHPGVSRQELLELFARDFPGPYRVNIQRFHVNKAVFDNVGRLISYGAKQAHTFSRDGTLKERYPIRWLAEYYVWLHSLRRSLQPLSVSLKPKKIGADGAARLLLPPARVGDLGCGDAWAPAVPLAFVPFDL